jgi:hypothetical protein
MQAKQPAKFNRGEFRGIVGNGPIVERCESFLKLYEVLVERC